MYWIALKPFAVIAYIGLISALYAAASSLPDGVVKRALTAKLPRTRLTGILVMTLGIIALVIPLAVGWRYL